MTSSISFSEIRRNVKIPENFWFHVFYFLSSFIVWVAIRFSISPNGLTLIAFGLNTLSAGYFLLTRTSTCSILLTVCVLGLAHLFDCADGQLASVTNQRSECGYWLDSALDMFKVAFVTACFCKLVILGGVDQAGKAAGWVSKVAMCGVMGIVINYAVHLHATRYKPRFDGYLQDGRQQSALNLIGSDPARSILSHIREYGNVLMVFGCLALNTNIAMSAVAFLGTAHLLLALHRVYRVARVI